ncbi:hypothetical protein T484DRAFT_1797349 [Baffinella frigidus]|nr:hypothetical protein T484DRAFT_1797349 [Cryptophyta sp. CCMP2293]
MPRRRREEEGAGPGASPEGIARVAAEDLPLERFWEEFMLANTPVLVSGLTDAWRISREWVGRDGRVRPEGIEALCGTARVTVAGMSQLRTREMTRGMPPREPL